MEELQLRLDEGLRGVAGHFFVDLADLGDSPFDRMGWIGAEVANY